MAYLTQLPCDVLDLIIIMLAISTNGAREIANISATCKLFRKLAGRVRVLSIINFSCLANTEDFTMHHHPKGLLCVCTNLGHKVATCIFAKVIIKKDPNQSIFIRVMNELSARLTDRTNYEPGNHALLVNDRWFRQMIAVSNQKALEDCVNYRGLLDYHSVVRHFIRYGSVTDMIKMYRHLLNYVTLFGGYRVCCRYGILCAINSMCFEMMRRVKEHRVRSLRLTGNATIYPDLLNYQVREDRKKVLVIFDQLFRPPPPPPPPPV